MEETGYDISARLSKTDFIEVHLGQDGLRQQRSKLFIVKGVGSSSFQSDPNNCHGQGKLTSYFSWNLKELTNS